MKLKCTIGSLSCDGILAERGDIFELPEEAGQSLLKQGYAVEVIEEPSITVMDEPIEKPDKEPRLNRGHKKE